MPNLRELIKSTLTGYTVATDTHGGRYSITGKEAGDMADEILLQHSRALTEESRELKGAQADSFLRHINGR